MVQKCPEYVIAYRWTEDLKEVDAVDQSKQENVRLGLYPACIEVVTGDVLIQTCLQTRLRCMLNGRRELQVGRQSFVRQQYDQFWNRLSFFAPQFKCVYVWTRQKRQSFSQ